VPHLRAEQKHLLGIDLPVMLWTGGEWYSDCGVTDAGRRQHAAPRNMPTLKVAKPLIEELKPQANDQAYRDQSVRGFGVNVTPAGRKGPFAMCRTTDGQRPSPSHSHPHSTEPQT
jgi:hypothetical protein